MTRVALALLALAPLAPAAPVPKEKVKAAPYPFEVGTRWEYTLPGAGTLSDEITHSEEKDGVRTVRLTTTPSDGKKRVVEYEFKDGELRLTAFTDVGRVQGSITVWKADMKAGDTWTNEYTVGGETYREVVSVGQAEEVTTPAGKYTAVPMVHVYKAPKGVSGYTDWYAPGVGHIRQTTDGQTEPAQNLKAFTPGKK